MINILIVEQGEHCLALEKYLEKQAQMQVVACASDKDVAFELMEKYKLDIVLLDLTAYGEDIDVLKEFTDKKEMKSKIIVISTIGSEEFVTKLTDSGVDYYLMKPFNLVTLVKRIQQVFEFPLTVDYYKNQQVDLIKQKVAKKFSLIGLSPQYKGYRYLIDAITLVALDKELINGVTKELYPRVANNYSIKTSQVERDIRHAIEVTWQKGNIDALDDLFGYSVDASKGKPTNSSFIAKMADIIKFEVIPYE